GKEVVMGGGKEAPQPVLPRITSRESRQTRRFHTVRRAAQDVVAAIGSSDSVPVARLIPQAAPARPTPAPPTPARACRLFQSNRDTSCVGEFYRGPSALPRVPALDQVVTRGGPDVDCESTPQPNARTQNHLLALSPARNPHRHACKTLWPVAAKEFRFSELFLLMQRQIQL